MDLYKLFLVHGLGLPATLVRIDDDKDGRWTVLSQFGERPVGSVCGITRQNGDAMIRERCDTTKHHPVGYTLCDKYSIHGVVCFGDWYFVPIIRKHRSSPEQHKWPQRPNIFFIQCHEPSCWQDNKHVSKATMTEPIVTCNPGDLQYQRWR